MQHANLSLIAPALSAPGHSEAEIFGSVVWLAMQAKNKSPLPLQDLSRWLLPALKSQQFVLASASVDGQIRPVAFMSWANLSASVESRYVDNPDEGLQPNEWATGDRMWVIDWLTPLGHSAPFGRAISALLVDSCARSLYHRGGTRGLRVQQFRGNHVSLSQAKEWWKSRPIMACRNDSFEEDIGSI